MAGRTTYTDAQKAEVYVVYAANEGNVKRTARDTGVPISTIRRWRDEWNRQENLPDVSVLEEAVGDFADKAESIRWKALIALEANIHTAKPHDLIKVIGILDDKITRARGLADRTVEHRHTLPSADELRELVGAFIEGSKQAALDRADDVIDAEIVEQAELPALPSGR